MSSYYGDRSQNVPSWDSLEAADEDDVVDSSEYAYASRDHILFCIDASKSMQTPYPDQSNPEGIIRGQSALHQVLAAVSEIERRKVITGPADSVGVLVYNIDPTKIASSSSGNYKPGTHIYQPLTTINAEEIKKIIKLVERARDEYTAQEEEEGKTRQPEVLGETFPPCKEGDELNIADVLVTCNFLFRDAGTKLAGNKRVFLVTDNDDPPGSGSNREPARTVYGDLLTYGITINTYFVDRPNHRFNPTLYWNDILNREPEEDAPSQEEPEVEGLAKLSEAMNELVIRHAPKRVQFTIPLKLGGKNGEIEIGVSGYALVSSQGKGQPKYVRMRGQAVEEVLTKSEYTSAETGAVLRDEEIGQAFQFGNESSVRNVLEKNWWESSEGQAQAQAVADEIVRLDIEKRRKLEEGEEVDDEKPEMSRLETSNSNGDTKERIVARTRLQFTDQEVKEFRSMGLDPQIKILGFQAPQNLSVDENIKHSYFIYPNESAYTGSTRTFAALLKSCLKLDRHALALCRFRANTTPEFAVLIPQEETFTSDGAQDTPPGFHVIVLPFADDLRSQPKGYTDNLTATERQAKLMSNIVKRLRIKAGKYRSEVYPNPSLAYHYAQLQSLAFEEDFDLESMIDEIDKTYPKYYGMHKAAGDFMAEWNRSIEEDERCAEVLKGGTKRAVIEVDEEDLVDVVGAYQEGRIEKLKVQELKDYAKFHKISLGGKTKKSDIIDELKEHLEKAVNGAGKKAKK
ncbi:SPOC like C-terminal domain-containing protein [Naematelia encephala]|uniref:ATP-dependent DNA helicase II subunit 1 n=1 Tax=Naematelia encephala TaxID=71784 RepID=A0A1Y2BF42_9TREE|nr:SPOC like C-terminal domain-containing protein [Naematelia encephala]